MFNIRNKVYLLSWVFFMLIIQTFAWDNDDLEVFDVVEEVNQNFYELLGLAQNASAAEIRSSFRSLSLKLHPDKNDAPDADVQFRNLVSVYNVLKDPGKREKYGEVLKNGLPNWRSAIYYYRHVRKMGLAEMCIILLILVTIGQYIVNWASYAEKIYNAQQILGARRKKNPKKTARNTVVAEPDTNEIIVEIPAPSVKNLLPCQIVKMFVWIICFIPKIPRTVLDFYAERKERQLEEERRLEEERLELLREEEELAKEKETKALRRRRIGFIPTERNYDEPGCYLDPVDEPENTTLSKAPPPVTGGLWTDDDLAELVKLVKKYSAGTSGRWERIAETMGRGVSEVTHMAAKLKDNCYRLPGSEQSSTETDIPGLEISKKVKTKGGKALPAGTIASVESLWSQTQQKALENALAKYPRGGASDRWEKIAKSVPDKTKEECMLRYKYLAELVKKQKSEENSETQTTPTDSSQPTQNEQKVENDKPTESSEYAN